MGGIADRQWPTSRYKRCEDKAIGLGCKKAYRWYDGNGQLHPDCLVLADEIQGGQALICAVMKRAAASVLAICGDHPRMREGAYA